MSKTRHAEIAEEIVRQIKVTDRFALMAWGATNLVALPEVKHDFGYQIAGLQFRVNGAKFKGLVKVMLMGNDTYRIECGSYTKDGWAAKHVVETCYCDNLMESIDEKIER